MNDLTKDELKEILSDLKFNKNTHIIRKKIQKLIQNYECIHNWAYSPDWFQPPFKRCVICGKHQEE